MQFKILLNIYMLKTDKKYVLSVKKSFNSRIKFYREILSLSILKDSHNGLTPRLIYIDDKNLLCFIEHIQGNTIEQIRLKNKQFGQTIPKNIITNQFH